jgi:glycosidase
VRQHILDVGAHWLREFKVDGWRLDYPAEIPVSFWKEFRGRCRAEIPHAVTVARGFIVNTHSTSLVSPPAPLRVCMSIRGFHSSTFQLNLSRV